MKNQLFIASAGAGKTTYFVKKALECEDKVLITTFTLENREEIRKKFIELNNGIVPKNVTIQTWFSFLIEHGAKPYQGKLTNKNINGLLLVSRKSGLKYKGKYPQYYAESDIDNHYFSSNYDIYSDKLSKFVVRCNEKSNGYVIDRISSLFPNIFIDEVQDMAGYDLEFIRLLLISDSNVKMAGDPRQVTYHTHFSDKYKKYVHGEIQNFISKECKNINCTIDTDMLKGSFRNNQAICDFANSIFPDQPQCDSLQHTITNHDGVFLIKVKDVDTYMKRYNPLQLRYDRRTKKIHPEYDVENFGESKGKTYDRVIIYPTKKMTEWILKGKPIDSFEIKCKLYVAITRAKYSVAIVCENNTESDRLPIFQDN